MRAALHNQRLFLDTTFRNEVERAFRHASKSIDVLVGFAKLSAMKWLSEQVASSDVVVSIIVGWTVEDLMHGSSDLHAYEFARDRGWRFGIRPGLHAKIFWADRNELLVGSANLTTRGLHLSGQGNIEAGVRVTPTNLDIKKLDRLIAKSVWLDDHLFDAIVSKLDSCEPTGEFDLRSITWPECLESALAETHEFLWVDDMFLTDPGSVQAVDGDTCPLAAHDRGLLNGFYIGDAADLLSDALRQTNAIRWLKEFLCTQPEHWARFGTVSAALHDALLDDPKPYRRDVKELQNNLFAWILHSKMHEFEVRQHRRTTSIHLRPMEQFDKPWM